MSRDEREADEHEDGAVAPWSHEGRRGRDGSKENPSSLREAGNNICFCLIPSQVMITIYII